MIYLGQLGRMIELKCPSSQQVAVEDTTSFKSTLEGRRIAQVSPSAGRRTWQCQLSDASTPGQVGAVMSFLNREWGNGPFMFVSADAPVTNLLTPAQASCDPKTFSGASAIAGGPMKVGSDDWAGRSVMNSNVTDLLGVAGNAYSPVLPGQRVTGSAYVLGAGAAVHLYFYDVNGVRITSWGSGVLGNNSTAVRSWVTQVAPSNAASARIFAQNAMQACRPAITWTDGLLDWADGQGCHKAIIHSPSRDLIMASRDPRGGRFSNLSFTVSEVG